MRLLLALAVAAIALQAAVIRGTVLENQTGRPVARAVVGLTPISGTPGKPLAVRTNSAGIFEFGQLSAGAYVIKASRRGFVPTEYGQKQWNSAGLPVTVAADDSPFLTIRLPRYGSITGTVVDENDVGLPEQDVVAYRFTQPPVLIARTTSDDRGVYRLSGLEPGIYLVRTAGKPDDGFEYVPTFSKETLRVEEARSTQVYLDEEAKNMDVRPVPGRLFTVSGAAIPVPPAGGPVSVTLVSDMGRLSATGPGFHFAALPPGPYELYAEVGENRDQHTPFQAVFTQLSVDRDMSVKLSLQPVRETRIELSPAELAARIQVSVRRKDLAGTGQPGLLTVTNGRATLAPGRWELLVTPTAGYYVSGFSGPSHKRGTVDRPDGWNEIVVQSYSMVRVTLSPGPGGLHGLVQATGGPVPGAPVYLEAFDPATHTRLLDLRSTRADMRGAYRFDGLAPGAYRITATFEYQAPDVAAMDTAGAKSVQVDAHADMQMDLDLYGRQ